MFLQNNPDFQPVFQARHANGSDPWSMFRGYGPLSDIRTRKLACWFQDMQYTLDHKDLENAQLLLVCTAKIRYGIVKEIGSEDETEERIRRRKASFKEEFFAALAAEHRQATEEDEKKYDKAMKDIEEEEQRPLLDELANTYNLIRNALAQIGDKCNTLSMAKAQLEAFERQQKKNSNPTPLHYQIADIPETTLNALYNLKDQYPSFNNRLTDDLKDQYPSFNNSLTDDKNTWIAACRRLWEKCRKQPISLVLLPTLLTVLMVEGVEHKSVYAYLKQTKKYVSVDNAKKIAQLYEDICGVLSLGYADCANWWIPVFNWDEIEKRFYEHNKLSDEDREVAHKYLSKLRYQNGLSKREERELTQVSYGHKLQALAKICNLNCFMMLALQTPEKITAPDRRTVDPARGSAVLISDPMRHRAEGAPRVINEIEPPNPNGKGIIISAKANSAYQLLRSGQILPRVKDSTQIFDSYFGDLYTRAHGKPDFSYIALLRHYRLSIDAIPRYMPQGLQRLVYLFTDRTSDYVRRITESFKVQQRATPMYADLESKTAKVSYATWISLLPVGSSEFRINCARNSHRLSSQIADKYSEEDYREFISNIDHFENPHFGKYLTCFCEKWGIDLYPSEFDYENVLLENAAFSTIMEFIRYYLEKNFYNYWKDHISTEFGLYDDNSPKV